MKSKFLFLALLALLPLLGGCTKEMASYQASPEQAFTLLREKSYPWDEEYRRAIVVMSMPKCMLRYKMPPDKGDIIKVTVYNSGDGYYVLKDKAGQYLANLADCSMSVVEKEIVDPGEFKGFFETLPGQPLRFVAAPAKPQPKAPVAPVRKSAN